VVGYGDHEETSRARGLAMGFNEFAGYVAVALAALSTGMVADRYSVWAATPLAKGCCKTQATIPCGARVEAVQSWQI
jgi:predicted MFS family arabinose efflux permease